MEEYKTNRSMKKSEMVKTGVIFSKAESKNFRNILNKMNERVQQSKKKKIRELQTEGED